MIRENWHVSYKPEIKEEDIRLPYKRVMLVEDSQVDVYLFQNIFSRLCPDGTLYTFMVPGEALAFLKTCDPQFLPELVIVDLFMPGKEHGLRFIHEFWNLPQHITAAIVMAYSAHVQESEGELKELKERKMILKYFSKPISGKKVMAA